MKSSFPNSSQFSPKQISLPDLLLILKDVQPNRQRMVEEIGVRFFNNSSVPYKLANNTILALSEYKLLDKPTTNTSWAVLTILGEELAERVINKQYDELYIDFARHIVGVTFFL